MTDQYQVRVGDFGSAYRVHKYLLSGRPQTATTNIMILDFANPSHPHDGTRIEHTSSDIFAIGVSMIELISHQQPLPTEYVR